MEEAGINDLNTLYSSESALEMSKQNVKMGMKSLGTENMVKVQM